MTRKPKRISNSWLVLLLVCFISHISPSMVRSESLDESSCKASEYTCLTGECVGLDRYCDGIEDCQDKSDEPQFCSPCNRTYFGDVARTYELEIRRPREDRLPFLCHLNFTAGGGNLGDIVQLTFDTFTVGKFVSFTSAGCPDGHMSIKEQDRPATGGKWCGSAWGYTVYYSETRSINVTLQLDRLSQQGIGYNFDFKLSYKFLRRSDARLRFGNNSLSSFRGDLVPGTYCDRVLEDCSKRPCRIQSPNYPGVYPRNVTCRYKIVEKRMPQEKHAMLAVRQSNSHKIHIKDQIVKYDRSQRVLRAWDQCNVVQDYLTVYDGLENNSPILVRLCGGDAVPEIVSSGSKMLLEFHTSPFDNPFHPVPLSYLPGFELEVQVLYVDIDSQTYTRENHKCEFLLTTFDSPSGVLENPRHSLAPNTTCRYHFQGKPNEIVWISFIKYYATSSEPAVFDLSDCNAQLRVWNGRLGSNGVSSQNVTILGEFCKDEVPRLCDHVMLNNQSRATRPCSLAESYVSSGPEMTIEHFIRQGSALYPVNFVLRYEFVDTSLEGTPNPTGVMTSEGLQTSLESNSIPSRIGYAPGLEVSPNAAKMEISLGPQTSNHLEGSSTLPRIGHFPDLHCDRIFRAPTGKFSSPKNTFMFGRGGQQNLTCLYRFEAPQGQRVKLTFLTQKFGDKSCFSRKDSKTGRWKCDQYHSKIPGIAQISIVEYPWPKIYLPRDCLCSNNSEPRTISTLTSQTVLVNFTITQMNITQDSKDFHFEGLYEFVPLESDDICPSSWSNRRLRGSSGEIALRNPNTPYNEVYESPGGLVDSLRSPNANENDCTHQPWLIEPEDPLNNFIYLKIRGFELGRHDLNCPTRNRIMVYSAKNPKNKRIICPANQDGPGSVEIFSDGWDKNLGSLELLSENSRSFIVEFLQKEPGNYMVTWIEVSKRPAITSSSSFVMNGPVDCPYRCPELNACISSSLWCDGLSHCPSGFDEQELNCSFQFGLPISYIIIGAGCLALLSLLVALTACIRCCQNRRKERKKLKMSNLANRNNHLHINHLHNHGSLGSSHLDSRTLRYHHTSDDFFLDGKDSLC